MTAPAAFDVRTCARFAAMLDDSGLEAFRAVDPAVIVGADRHPAEARAVGRILALEARRRQTPAAPAPAPAPEPVKAAPRVRVVFDRLECGRCGGTGRYQSFGACYSCGGSGGKHSRAGAAAYKLWSAWKDANLAIEPDASAVGRRAYIPRQFVGPQMGGQWVTYKGEREIVAVVPTDDTERRGVRVSFRVKLASPSPWLAYDAETHTLTVTIYPGERRSDYTLYRAPTGEELRAVVPTLGAGARLEEIPAAK